MTLALRIDPIDQLPQTPATDVKKLGWRGVMKSVARSGMVVVTNHNEPEAVILSVHEYAAIKSALHEAANRSEPTLDALRQRFDERLSVLQEADAGQRLRKLMETPAQLDGKLRAGTGF